MAYYYDDDFMEDDDFAQAFAYKQARENHVDYCDGCDGEDCPCCQHNPNKEL